MVIIGTSPASPMLIRGVDSTMVPLVSAPTVKESGLAAPDVLKDLAALPTLSLELREERAAVLADASGCLNLTSFTGQL